MHERLLPIEIARRIDIIEHHGGRGIDFDAAIQAPETMNPIHQALAAGQIVANFDGDGRLFAGLDQIGDVVLVAPAITGKMPHQRAIQVEPTLGVDAADLQPDAPARKCGRYIDLLFIPRRADVGADHRPNALLGRYRARISGSPDALSLPAAGNFDRPLFRQRRFGKLPFLFFADVLWIDGEIPYAIQIDRRPQGRADRRIDHRRRRFTLGRHGERIHQHYRGNSDQGAKSLHEVCLFAGVRWNCSLRACVEARRANFCPRSYRAGEYVSHGLYSDLSNRASQAIDIK